MSDSCSDVLQKTEINSMDTIMLKIAYLKTIDDQASFNSAQQAAGGLAAVFDDIPLQATANWSDFQNYRSRKLATTDYTFNDEEAHRLITTFLPPDAVNAWRDCMLRKTNGGLEVYLQSITKEELTAVVYWTPPPTITDSIKILDPKDTGGLQGGDFLGNDDAWPFPVDVLFPPWTTQLRFSRRPDQDFVLGLNTDPNPGNWTPELIVPAAPKFKDSSVWKIGSANADQPFQGISADASGLTGVTIGAKNFEPGTLVQAVVNGQFKIDHGGNWILMEVSLNGGTRAPLYTGPLGSGPDTGDPFQLGCTTEFSKVPWDGIVTLTIYVERAEDSAGTNGTLSALPGGTIVIQAPKGGVPKISSRPIALSQRRLWRVGKK
jgi:hypothetical protein